MYTARIFAFLFLLLTGISGLQAQYEFEPQHKLVCTEVKSQDRSGTCWSYSTVSFLESELARFGKSHHDLSEMYVVRTIYQDKARNYILRQGKANFSQGSLSHDVIRAMEMGGLMPESAYSGLLPGETKHDHSEMLGALKGMLDGVMAGSRLSVRWQEGFEALLDVYMGPVPAQFEYEGKIYSPAAFADDLELNPSDYVSLTSFTHHPFYEEMILEIPDNYSNGSYYNVPLDELEMVVDYSLSREITVAWDGDVSEKTFKAGEGLAILPTDPERTDLYTVPGDEVSVTQDLRQDAFMTYATTDDHLMHIVGSAVDQYGNKYYVIKNSWGEIGPYNGFLYMSAAYFRMKTVGILVHRNGIPPALRAQLKL